ncbi:MAG: protein-L-isoaspartate(D-aspartate) O-methyltransferase [candidate division WOR-3 bacterium]|nr:protein-L-isoaspartate(D-aspartate) O-methyltransferase [candidate division WOR-3 bacterium]
MTLDEFVLKRTRMVEEQIVARGVRDKRVLEAMRKVPRHLFVPEGFVHQAYDDNPLPIGQGQTISQPYIVAAMSEALQVEKNHRVLEIGTGSGYQTAILAELAQMVWTVEIIEELSIRARQVLNRLDYRNIRFRIGDGNMGWPEFAPYDRIIVTAAAENFPYKLTEQLVEGGRIVVPVGYSGGQTLILGVKHGKRVVQRPLMDVVFVPLVRGKPK